MKERRNWALTLLLVLGLFAASVSGLGLTASAEEADGVAVTQVAPAELTTTTEDDLSAPENAGDAVAPTAEADGEDVAAPDAAADGEEIAAPDAEADGEEIAAPEKSESTGSKDELSACPRDNTCPLTRFTDAKSTAWYHDGLHYCLEKGIMNGTSDTAFKPGGTATRGMIATMLYRMAGEPAFMNDNIFADVPANSYYEKPVVWASGKGIVNGTGHDLFKPDNPITREQLVTILYRYAAYTGLAVDVDGDSSLLAYQDAGTVSEYAVNAMEWACSVGILNGNNKGLLNPAATATRAEVATMFQRFCAVSKTAEKVPEKEPAPVEGDWELNGDFTPAELPEGVQATFDKAMEGFAGVGYHPVAYLGCQPLADGGEYALLCTSVTVTATPEPGLAVVTVKGTEEAASILKIQPVKLPDVIGPELTFPGDSAWDFSEAVPAALPINVQVCFDKAMEGFAGVGYAPVGYLGYQMAEGANYAILCIATQVTKTPASALAVVVFNAGTEGSTSLVSISGFELP